MAPWRSTPRNSSTESLVMRTASYKRVYIVAGAICESGTLRLVVLKTMYCSSLARSFLALWLKTARNPLPESLAN